MERSRYQQYRSYKQQREQQRLKSLAKATISLMEQQTSFFEQLHTRLSAISGRLSSLEAKARFSSVRQRKTHHGNLQLIRNLGQFASDLPHNSAIRAPMIRELSLGLTNHFMASLFSVDARTIIRSKRSTSSFHLVAVSGMTRVRKQEAIKDMISTVNDLIPVQSGRNYRIQQVSNTTLYLQYKARASIKPVSPTKFDRYLKQLNIVHSPSHTACPYCTRRNTLLSQATRTLAEGLELQELHFHVEAYTNQCNHYSVLRRLS